MRVSLKGFSLIERSVGSWHDLPEARRRRLASRLASRPFDPYPKHCLAPNVGIDQRLLFAGESQRPLRALVKEQVEIFWRVEQQARQKREFVFALGQSEIGEPAQDDSEPND